MKMTDLLKKKNVVVVARGRKTIGGVRTDRDAIVVGVTRKITPWQAAMDEIGISNLVPLTIKIKGVEIETDVIEVGEIRALAVDRKSKLRPAPGGCSTGHFAITAGTLGMIVKKNGIRHILSNNHVLSNSNNARVGDQTWQPGSADGGTAADTIGHLAQFKKIRFEGESSCSVAALIAAVLNFWAEVFKRTTRLYPISEVTNKVDCAISRPLIDNDVSDEILEIGKPSGFNLAVAIGDNVRKSGRTTGLNNGTVIAIDGVAKVTYGADKTALFEDQILTTAIAKGGDSGSAVLNDNKEVIGLLFAGSEQMTIVNKIQNIIAALGLDD